MSFTESYSGYDTVSIIVERPSLRRFLLTSGRRLLYGRRKTGKTFYARHVLGNYEYFIVRKGGTIYDPVNDEELDTSAFIRVCRHTDRVILDEFHRANPRLFDAVQAGVCGENLVFITSTLHYYRVFVEGPEAPLTGLFLSERVGLLSPLELLATRGWGLEGRELVEHLVYYQEPVLIGRGIRDIVLYGRELAHTLVGEVLDEEDYTYTRRFDAVLEAIAAGKTKLTEIASYLYSRGLLEKPATSLITKYVKAMVETGLLERIETLGKKRRSIYRHVSPLTETIYYLEARYGFGEAPLPWGYIEKALQTLIPRLVERFVERFLSEYYGLRPVRIESPEIDVALVEYRSLRVVAEVKWVNRLSTSDVKRIEAKLARFPEAEKILIVPDKTIVPETWLQVWDISDLVARAREKLSKEDNQDTLSTPRESTK